MQQKQKSSQTKAAILVGQTFLILEAEMAAALAGSRAGSRLKTWPLPATRCLFMLYKADGEPPCILNTAPAYLVVQEGFRLLCVSEEELVGV